MIIRAHSPRNSFFLGAFGGLLGLIGWQRGVSAALLIPGGGGLTLFGAAFREAAFYPGPHHSGEGLS
jgi:hypothetical protein